MKPIALTVMACLLGTGLPSYAGNTCEVKSGTATAALVELYTSEGCSSCPPADKQLSRLKEQVGADAAIVSLSLHVTYWDAIGWKDVFAQKAFDARQSNLLEGKPNHVVYTPQFFVGGSELRAWQGNLPDTIRRINARPAPVAITLKTAAVDNGNVSLDVMAQSVGAKKIDGELYVAVSENGLTSKVLRGENSGVTLHHDNTVRLWYGPIKLNQGAAQFRQEVRLPSGWNRQNLQAIAFVQEPNDGNVLQAVSTAQCTPSTTRGL
jgi:hypothetical protein